MSGSVDELSGSSVVDGSVVDGPVVDGSVVDGSVVDGSVVVGSVLGSVVSLLSLLAAGTASRRLRESLLN